MNFDPPKKIVLGLIVAAVIALVVLRAAEDREAARPTSPSSTGSTPETGSDPPMSAPGSTAKDPSAADAHETSPQALTATKPETPSAHSAGSLGTEGPPDEGSDDDDAEPEPPPRTIWSADVAGIRSAVAENLHELQSCYEQWLRLDPDIAGKVVIEFAIQTADVDDSEAPRAEDGTALALIEELGLVSTVEHAFMEGCVSSVFADLWFSPPGDGRMEVTYPLVFSNPD